MKKLFIVLSFAMLLASCRAVVGDFTAISTKNVDLGTKYIKTKTVETQQSTWFIFGFPTNEISLMSVVTQCLEEGGGEYATNVKIMSETLPLALASKLTYEIKADVWKRASTADLSNPNNELFELQRNHIGKLEMISLLDTKKKIEVFE